MPADRLLGTLLRSLQTYTDQQDTPRLLGTAASLLTTLNNPLNVTLLTSQLISAPAIWTQPEGLRTCMRSMSVFHSGAQALVRHENAAQDQSPDRDFSQLQLERTLPRDDWIKAVINGADKHSPRWRHSLVFGGLLLGFGQPGEGNLSHSMRSTLEQALVNAVNLALDDIVEDDKMGQQTIAIVLNHCFPSISDIERSLINFDRLLPALMSSTFHSSEGLGSAYFLGAVDLDVTLNSSKQYTWPESAPSYQQIRAMSASPLGSSLGPLSRLIGHTIEQVQESWLVTSAVEDLEDFTRTLHLQWRQNKLAEIDAADEQSSLDHPTLHKTTPALWRLLRSTMYAAVIVLRSAVGRVMSDGTLGMDEHALNIAVRSLHILRNLYFVSARSGAGTFSQYIFVQLTAMDILGNFPTRVQEFLEAIRPSEPGAVPKHPLDRNLDLFFLNVAEHFTLLLPPAVAETLLVQSALPYLAAGGNNNMLPIFEAAHSVVLASFSAPQNESLVARHLPFYVDALFKVFPQNVSARQFRLAFKTLVQIASPPSPLATSQPLLPAILLELLRNRAERSFTSPLPRTGEDAAMEQAIPLSEQAVVVLTVLDTLTQLPLDLLDDWLPMAADMVNAIDDANMQEHCREHFWLILVDGGMDPDRSRICHGWWSSAGGREHVLRGRDIQSDQVPAISGALPAADTASKM